MTDEGREMGILKKRHENVHISDISQRGHAQKSELERERRGEEKEENERKNGRRRKGD